MFLVSKWGLISEERAESRASSVDFEPEADAGSSAAAPQGSAQAGQQLLQEMLDG